MSVPCPVHSTPEAPRPLFLLAGALIGTLTCDGRMMCISAAALSDLHDGAAVRPAQGPDGRTYVVLEKPDRDPS